jgi:hypothetical protein
MTAPTTEELRALLTELTAARWNYDQLAIQDRIIKRLPAFLDRIEALEGALRHIIGAANEAPCFGPFDQIDNYGEPYQSADFFDALSKGRTLLATLNAEASNG